jgi:putative transposase
LIHQKHDATRRQARQSIFQYIEKYYNRKPLRRALGYRRSESFEAG